MSALQIAGLRRWMPAVAVLTVTAAAPGQFGLTGGMVDAFRPAFTSRDVQIAVDMLRLDDTQKFIVETLFEDYETGFRTGVDGFRDQVATWRDKIDPNTNDPSQILKAVFGSMKQWRDESRQLADKFMADLKDLLNQDQTQSWPAFQRKLFRLKYLSSGQLPGENLDLTNSVRDLRLDEVQTEKLRPLLEQYEAQLDDALHRREQYIQSSQDDLLEAIQDQNYRIGEEVADRQVELRKGVRDVNEQYVVLIAGSLPEDAGKSFLRSIREQTYPRIFREMPAERAFDAAAKLDGLSDDTRRAVVDLGKAFASELDAFNQHVMQLYRDYKPQELKNKVQGATRRLAGAEVPKLDDPTRQELAKRNDIANRYMEQLKALLTPEQFAGLPGAKRFTEPDEQAAADVESAKQRILSRRLREPAEGENVPQGVATGAPAEDNPKPKPDN